MSYLISEENLERQRLLTSFLGPTTDKLLDSLALPPSSRCLDIGCGIGESTRQLAKRIPHSSEVIGIEQDLKLVDTATQLLGTVDCEVRFQQGDATNLDFPDHTFDLVFARYLLAHMEDPNSVVKEMLRVCRSGGIVALQEPDMGSGYAHPPNWALEKCFEAVIQMFPDALIGRKLYSILRQMGYTSPRVDADCTATVNSDYKRWCTLTTEAMGPAMVEKGLMETEEVEKMSEEISRLEKDENTLFLSHTIYSAWVIKK